MFGCFFEGKKITKGVCNVAKLATLCISISPTTGWATGPTLAQTTPPVVDMDPQLSATQKTELEALVCQFKDVFSEAPGRTTVIEHEIRTPPGVIVRQRSYRIPEARRPAIEEEVQKMIQLGIIEPSRSPWASPIVMVTKARQHPRFL